MSVARTTAAKLSDTVGLVQELTLQEDFHRNKIKSEFVSEKLYLDTLSIFSGLKTRPEPSNKRKCNCCGQRDKEVLWLAHQSVLRLLLLHGMRDQEAPRS